MIEVLKTIFTPGNFEPHIRHFVDTPGLVWWFYVSNAVIALAYTVIPLTLIYIIRKRKDIPFNWVFWSFAGFIVFCGITHIMHIMVFNYPAYYLQAILDVMTAIISIATATALIYIIPVILKVPNIEIFRKTNEKLENTNQVLQREVDERKKIEKELKDSAEKLAKSNKEFKEKSDQLKKFNDLMVGRELKMAEMKKEMEEFKKRTI